MRILMTVDEAKALVKSRLSEKRYKHTINVKKMAVKLAKRYGADEEKAALAALLHDSAKELPKAEMLQIFADNAIIAKNAAKRPAPVWHGYAASVLCQTQWGVHALCHFLFSPANVQNRFHRQMVLQCCQLLQIQHLLHRTGNPRNSIRFHLPYFVSGNTP